MIAPLQIEGDTVYVDGEFVPYTPAKEDDPLAQPPPLAPTTSAGSLPVYPAAPQQLHLDEYVRASIEIEKDRYTERARN